MTYINKKLLLAIGYLSAVFLAMSLFVTVQGQGFSFSYGGDYPYGDLYLDDSPAIVFSAANGSVVYNNPNMTLGFSTGIGFPQGIQTLMTTLTVVSYKASWQDNQTVVLYNSTIDTPAILTSVPAGDGDFSYNFIDIPLGSQQLEVDVVGGGIAWGGNTYYTFYTNSSSTLNFTVQTEPVEDTFPTLLVIAVAILMVVIAVCIGLLLFKKHRKPSFYQ